MSWFRGFWERWGVSVDEAVQLAPEEVAEHVIEFLTASNPAPGKIGPSLFTNESAIAAATSTDPATTQRLSLLMAEAWNWLERQGFVVVFPGDYSRNHYFLSSWGRAYRTRASVQEYRSRLQLRADQLRPALAKEVIPQFLHANLRAAIQGAFALIERRLRDLLRDEGSSSSEELDRLTGADLASKAFGKKGLLRVEMTDDDSEGVHRLLLGAFGLWRNDSSHWRTDTWAPNDAVSIVLFANYLLGLLEERGLALSAWSGIARPET